MCEGGGSSGAVTHVANACKALKFVNIVFAEECRNKSHGFADADFIAVCNCKTCAFLTAVLQGVKSHGYIAYNAIAIVDADNATFLVQFVEHNASF